VGQAAADRNVISWLTEGDEDRVFLSFAEIRRGIELLPAGHRRERLATWLAEELPARFEERVLNIDQHVAEIWGVIMARGRKIGLTLGSMDGFVAATTEAHGLTLVTRNVKDFQGLGYFSARPLGGASIGADAFALCSAIAALLAKGRVKRIPVYRLSAHASSGLSFAT
jgi:predicted nucleic acid-binding protein